MASPTFSWHELGVESAVLCDGIALLQNDDPGTIEVTEIILDDAGGSDAALTTSGQLTVSKISAYSGGVDQSARYTKHNTSASDLPEEVTFVAVPQQVTEVDILRSIAESPRLQHAVSALGVMSAMAPTSYPGRDDSASVFNVGKSTVECIVLNEGEGIAGIQKAESFSHRGSVQLLVTVVATGSTYSFYSRRAGSMPVGRACWALMNGTGSGVVLEVRRVWIPEETSLTSNSTNAPNPAMLRLVVVDGFDARYSPEIEPGTAPVSLNTVRVLPSSVRCYRGAFALAKIGVERGVLYTSLTTDHSFATSVREQAAGCFRSITRVPRLNRAGTPVRAMNPGSSVWSSHGGSGIVLRKGQGLAIATGNGGIFDYGPFNYYNMTVRFVYTPDAKHPATGGGVVRGGGGAFL